MTWRPAQYRCPVALLTLGMFRELKHIDDSQSRFYPDSIKFRDSDFKRR